jgi:transcription elongation GreA/GreB family factor
MTDERIDKRALVARLRERIASDLQAATRAAKDAAEAATHAENKPESDKDMRSTEASYLARGQAERVRELERSDNVLQFLVLRAWSGDEAIGVGAIAVTEREGGRSVYFLAPAGGGMRVTIEGVEVQVVTPQSPLGQGLVGRSVGDVVQLRVPGGARDVEIVDVQ